MGTITPTPCHNDPQDVSVSTLGSLRRETENTSCSVPIVELFTGRWKTSTDDRAYDALSQRLWHDWR
jgi:hypothetical protein